MSLAFSPTSQETLEIAVELIFEKNPHLKISKSDLKSYFCFVLLKRIFCFKATIIIRDRWHSYGLTISSFVSEFVYGVS